MLSLPTDVRRLFRKVQVLIMKAARRVLTASTHHDSRCRLLCLCEVSLVSVAADHVGALKGECFCDGRPKPSRCALGMRSDGDHA
jgi:hypothetical protein